jgi:hypothetical protein
MGSIIIKLNVISLVAILYKKPYSIQRDQSYSKVSEKAFIQLTNLLVKYAWVLHLIVEERLGRFRLTCFIAITKLLATSN